MSAVLISLLIQGVADLIGTLLLGMEQFMASMKTSSHFLQKTSVLSPDDAIGSCLCSCLAKVRPALLYNQIFFVGGLVSLGEALSLRVTCTA